MHGPGSRWLVEKVHVYCGCHSPSPFMNRSRTGYSPHILSVLTAGPLGRGENPHFTGEETSVSENSSHWYLVF